MNRNDKCSSISIVALILEVMIQILSVFSVKLTSALEIYHQKHRRTGREGGGGGGCSSPQILGNSDFLGSKRKFEQSQV